MTMTAQAALHENLKRLIIESLNLEGLTPDKIDDDMPLFGDGLGLDSVDALELVLAMEKEYGIEIQAQDVDKTVFTSVSSLGTFVAGRLAHMNNNSPSDGT
jgi:acyl carrier protein